MVLAHSVGRDVRGSLAALCAARWLALGFDQDIFVGQVCHWTDHNTDPLYLLMGIDSGNFTATRQKNQKILS